MRPPLSSRGTCASGFEWFELAARWSMSMPTQQCVGNFSSDGFAAGAPNHARRCVLNASHASA
jgi:hypothetical protein